PRLLRSMRRAIGAGSRSQSPVRIASDVLKILGGSPQNGSAGDEQKNATKQEGKMPSDQIPRSQVLNPPRNRGRSTASLSLTQKIGHLSQPVERAIGGPPFDVLDRRISHWYQNDQPRGCRHRPWHTSLA